MFALFCALVPSPAFSGRPVLYPGHPGSPVLDPEPLHLYPARFAPIDRWSVGIDCIKSASNRSRGSLDRWTLEKGRTIPAPPAGGVHDLKPGGVALFPALCLWCRGWVLSSRPCMICFQSAPGPSSCVGSAVALGAGNIPAASNVDRTKSPNRAETAAPVLSA